MTNKRNFNKPILDLRGEPIAVIHPETNEKLGEWTYKKAAEDALLNQGNEERLTGEEQVSNFRLAERIVTAKGEIELTHEEIVHLKKRVSKSFTSLIVGRMYELLDGESKSTA